MKKKLFVFCAMLFFSAVWLEAGDDIGYEELFNPGQEIARVSGGSTSDPNDDVFIRVMKSDKASDFVSLGEKGWKVVDKPTEINEPWNLVVPLLDNPGEYLSGTEKANAVELDDQYKAQVKDYFSNTYDKKFNSVVDEVLEKVGDKAMSPAIAQQMKEKFSEELGKHSGKAILRERVEEFPGIAESEVNTITNDIFSEIDLDAYNPNTGSYASGVEKIFNAVGEDKDLFVSRYSDDYPHAIVLNAYMKPIGKMSDERFKPLLGRQVSNQVKGRDGLYFDGDNFFNTDTKSYSAPEKLDSDIILGKESVYTIDRIHKVTVGDDTILVKDGKVMTPKDMAGVERPLGIFEDLRSWVVGKPRVRGFRHGDQGINFYSKRVFDKDNNPHTLEGDVFELIREGRPLEGFVNDSFKEEDSVLFRDGKVITSQELEKLQQEQPGMFDNLLSWRPWETGAAEATGSTEAARDAETGSQPPTPPSQFVVQGEQPVGEPQETEPVAQTGEGWGSAALETVQSPYVYGPALGVATIAATYAGYRAYTEMPELVEGSILPKNRLEAELSKIMPKNTSMENIVKQYIPEEENLPKVTLVQTNPDFSIGGREAALKLAYEKGYQFVPMSQSKLRADESGEHLKQLMERVKADARSGKPSVLYIENYDLLPQQIKQILSAQEYDPNDPSFAIVGSVSQDGLADDADHLVKLDDVRREHRKNRLYEYLAHENVTDDEVARIEQEVNSLLPYAVKTRLKAIRSE